MLFEIGGAYEILGDLSEREKCKSYEKTTVRPSNLFAPRFESTSNRSVRNSRKLVAAYLRHTRK